MRERSGTKRRKVRGKQTNTQFGRQRLTGGFRLDVLSTPGRRREKEAAKKGKLQASPCVRRGR